MAEARRVIVRQKRKGTKKLIPRVITTWQYLLNHCLKEGGLNTENIQEVILKDPAFNKLPETAQQQYVEKFHDSVLVLDRVVESWIDGKTFAKEDINAINEILKWVVPKVKIVPSEGVTPGVKLNMGYSMLYGNIERGPRHIIEATWNLFSDLTFSQCRTAYHNQQKMMQGTKWQGELVSLKEYQAKRRAKKID